MESSSSCWNTFFKECFQEEIVIYEILTRISVAPLLSHCRLVCKGMGEDSNYFRLLDSDIKPRKNASSFVSLVNQSPALPSPTLDFLPGHVEIYPHHPLMVCFLVSVTASKLALHTSISKAIHRRIPERFQAETNQYRTLKTAIVVRKSSSPMHYNIFVLPLLLLGMDNASGQHNLLVASDDQFKPSSFLGSAIDPGLLIHEVDLGLTNPRLLGSGKILSLIYQNISF
ncbi:hypothetical protein MKW92_026729 [Papaver armeniacum]|nr:hypothetical protein MKW92_026729 [Papaver armeniacum]